MSLIISLKVVPSSRVARCTLKNNELTCMVQEPPEQGKANKAVCTFIADALGIPKRLVSVRQGFASRKKVIEIDAPVTRDQLLLALGIEIQQMLIKE